MDYKIQKREILTLGFWIRLELRFNIWNLVEGTEFNYGTQKV